MALQIFKFYHQESNINLEVLEVIKMPYSGQTLSKKCRCSIERKVETRPFARSTLITILFNVALVTFLWRTVVLEIRNRKFNVSETWKTLDIQDVPQLRGKVH